MKWMKRVSIWIVVSLSVQCLCFFYVEHYFLAADSKVITKKIDEVKGRILNSNNDITIPVNSSEKVKSGH